MSSQKKYYLEMLPYERSDTPKKNGFKFDMDCKKWYTFNESHPLLKDFKKVIVDFKEFRKDHFLYFDHDLKQWYTYTGNETFSEYQEN